MNARLTEDQLFDAPCRVRLEIADARTTRPYSLEQLYDTGLRGRRLVGQHFARVLELVRDEREKPRSGLAWMNVHAEVPIPSCGVDVVIEARVQIDKGAAWRRHDVDETRQPINLSDKRSERRRSNHALLDDLPKFTIVRANMGPGWIASGPGRKRVEESHYQQASR